MVITRLFSNFRQEMKAKQFVQLQHDVLRTYGTDSKRRALLLGNLRFGAYDFDAVLVVDTCCFIFEFKELCSSNKLQILSNGWFCGKERIWTGKLHVDTPLTQMRIKRNVLWGYLRKKHIQGINYIHVIICFQHNFAVTDPHELLTTCRWLEVAPIKLALSTAQAIQSTKARLQIDWDQLLTVFRVNDQAGPFSRKTRSSWWSRIVASLLPKAS